MTDKYTYAPTFLIKTTTLLKDANKRIGAVVNRPLRIPEPTIEEMKLQFRKYVDSDSHEEALTWFSRLSRQKRIAIPLLFDGSLSDDWKWTLSSGIRKWGEKDGRMLRPTALMMYQTGEVRFLWQVMQHIYKNSKTPLSRDSRELWDAYVSVQDPYEFVSNKLRNSKNVTSVYEPLFIHESSFFGEKVFAELFKAADQKFFLDHTDFFIQYFKKVDIEEKRQLADHMIQVCNLDAVSQISAVILREMEIYTTRPLLWDGVSNSSKEKFKNWHLLKIIEGSGERSDYWRKHIHQFENIVSKHSVWLMYAKDIVIVEVLRENNALYVYQRNDFEDSIYPRLEIYLHKGRLTSAQDSKYIRTLKNQSLAVGRLSHNGDWQRLFSYWLMQNYGWEMRI